MVNKYKNVDIGETTNIAGVEWIVLDKIAIDHGLASPDTADKTYRKALSKMKKKFKKKDIS